MHALGRLLIIHADHEQNASTSTVRLAATTPEKEAALAKLSGSAAATAASEAMNRVPVFMRNILLKLF